MLRRRNKRQRHLEDLSQALKDSLSKNEDLEIVDDKIESVNDVIKIYMESFSSVIQSNLNNFPLYYSGD